LVQSLTALGEAHARTSPFDLNLIVRNVVELRRRQHSEDIDVDMDLDGSLPKAVGDPALIEQLVLTFLINAEDSVSRIRPQAGLIEVRTSTRNNRIQLHI